MALSSYIPSFVLVRNHRTATVASLLVRHPSFMLSKRSSHRQLHPFIQSRFHHTSTATFLPSSSFTSSNTMKSLLRPHFNSSIFTSSFALHHQGSNSSAPRPIYFQPHSHYHDKVLDHYEQPRNVGSMNKFDKRVGTGIVGAPACGDVMKLQIRVDEATGKIEAACFKTFGCGSAIASSSLATEWVQGLSLEDASKITNTSIAKELSLPPVKLHCSMLAEDAIRAAIQDYHQKNNAHRIDSQKSTLASADSSNNDTIKSTNSSSSSKGKKRADDVSDQ